MPAPICIKFGLLVTSPKGNRS